MSTNRFAPQYLIDFGLNKGREVFWFTAIDTPHNRILLRLTAQRWANEPGLWFTQTDAEQCKEVIG